MNQTGEVSRKLGPPFLARGGPRRRPWLQKPTKWNPKGYPPEPQVGSLRPNMVPRGAKGAQHHAPEPQNATPKPPQGTKKGAKGIENTCVRQTARSDYRNSRQASSQRYALRPWTPCLQKAAPTGKSSQACFARTDHTASSQGHPSHTPQRIHPISYAKAISLQHTSSSHPDHTSSN